MLDEINSFDLDSPLVCEGIVGDGCGGGRLFMIENETLIAYDPITKKKFQLLQNVLNAKEISKSACIVTIICESEVIEFDLSLFKK